MLDLLCYLTQEVTYFVRKHSEDKAMQLST